MKKFLLFLLALTLCGTANAAWYVVGEFNGWNLATAVEMNESAADEGYIANIPHFSSNFKIVEDRKWDNQWGSDGVNAKLNENCPIKQFGENIVFDDCYYVDNATVTFTPNDKYVKVSGTPTYVVGGYYNGWKTTAGSGVLMTKQSDGTFKAEIPGIMESNFKIIDKPDWSGANYGATSDNDKIEFNTPLSLVNDGSSKDMTFKDGFFVKNTVMTLNTTDNTLTVAGEVSEGPDLWLPGSWAAGESDPNRLWATCDDTKMTKNGTIYTISYTLTQSSYESKVSAYNWANPQWGAFDADSKVLSMNNTPVSLDRKGQYEPGNFKIAIDTSLPGEYIFTFDYSTGNMTISIPTTETVELDANNLGTHCSHYNLKFEETDNVRAYKFIGYEDGKLIGERLIGVVPAGTGLYLQGVNKTADPDASSPAVSRADGTFVVNITSDAPTVDVSDNLMKPAYKNGILPATEPFVSSDVDRTVIYLYDAGGKFKNNETEGVSPANMAYVAVQSSEEHPGAPTTGIETITSDVQPAKAMTGIYSITGLRFPDNTDVNSLQPGFYIVNGKKLLVK
mgnify:CR=1 FL=1